jgi:hypothetical protein
MSISNLGPNEARVMFVIPKEYKEKLVLEARVNYRHLSGHIAKILMDHVDTNYDETKHKNLP